MPPRRSNKASSSSAPAAKRGKGKQRVVESDSDFEIEEIKTSGAQKDAEQAGGSAQQGDDEEEEGMTLDEVMGALIPQPPSSKAQGKRKRENDDEDEDDEEKAKKEDDDDDGNLAKLLSSYFCKRCPCVSLHWQFTDRRHCDKCGHSPMFHTLHWNQSLLKPIQRTGATEGEGKEAFQRLRLLLSRIMLRRTKIERADDMGLPPRTLVVRRDVFNEEEEDLYASLYTNVKRKFSTYLDQGTLLNNYSNIFTLLTRMRQMACHPDLVLRSKTGVAKKLLGDDLGEGAHMCRLCTDEADDPIMSKCRHVFCRECVRYYYDKAVEDGEEPDCPQCHAVLSIDFDADAIDAPEENRKSSSARESILERLDMGKWRSSTKIEALLEELERLKSEDKTIKSIVFSQYTNFLDLIGFRLKRAGYKICRLEGGMGLAARNATIEHFMKNADVTVFMVSLKAGGVALNLTEASRVFLMDPWWNPSVEIQAMDRIHRLGQYRPIVVTRLIIENSIESRIIQLQEKKGAMIEAALAKDDKAMGRLSVADLAFLFSL